jgi:hypothetical protein
MAVLPAELLLSAFPIMAVELLVVSGLGRTGKRWRKVEQNARDEQVALPQQFRQRAATMLAQANPTMTVAEINTLLAQLGGPQGTAAVPGNAPGRPALHLLPAAVGDTAPRTSAAPPGEPAAGPQDDAPPAAPANAPERPTADPRNDTPRPGGLGDVRVFGRNTPPRTEEAAQNAPTAQPPHDPTDDPPTWSVA